MDSSVFKANCHFAPGVCIHVGLNCPRDGKQGRKTYRPSESAGEKSIAVADDGVLIIALVIHSSSHCCQIFT